MQRNGLVWGWNLQRKVVLIQGAFDIINYGHVRAFKFAKSQGDYLIVAVNSNTLMAGYKRRQPIMAWWQKKRIIESIRYVDKVVKAPEFSPIKLLKKYKVDVYVITREHRWTKAREMAYMKKKGGKTVFSRRFNGVSTTEVKLRLAKEYLDAARGSQARVTGPIASKPNGAATGNGPLSSHVFTHGEALRTIWQREYGPFGPRLPKGDRARTGTGV